ncbi:MAG TPA: hypothetical protein VFD58_35200 [Blastocatellia bacterium]|nr:hypothetical protein [Blastocatellia bacterium]
MGTIIFLTLILLILLAALVAAIAFLRPKQGAAGADDSYNKLLRKSLGDPVQVERLIEAERKRHPNATRERLMRHAIERWESHNR